MNVSHNQLSELPVELNQLSSLFTLHADHNSIAKLSEDNLPKNIRILNLASNKIEYLPDIDIKPQTVNFDFNPLKNIPSNWFKDNDRSKYLINYFSLSFSNCALTSLPDILSNIDINTFSFSHNNITTLPADLGLDHFILKIDLSNNPISQLPEHIFEQSRDIILNDTKIDYIPKFCPTPEVYAELHLKNTPISDFPDLSCIEEMHLLDIRGTNIEKIPSYVKDIKIHNVFISDRSLDESFNSESNIHVEDSYSGFSKEEITLLSKMRKELKE